MAMKSFRRKKSISRNERAEKYSSKFNLRSEFSRGLVPRLSLVAIFIACGVLLLPPSQPVKEVMFRAGDIADRDIIAPFNFKVPLPQEELDISRAKAELRVLPVYQRRHDIERGLQRDLSALLDTVSTILKVDTLDTEAKMDLVSGWLPSLERNTLRAAVEKGAWKALSKAALDYQSAIFARGLVDNASPLRRNDYTKIAVIDGNQEKNRSVREVLDQGILRQVIREEALSQFGNNLDRAGIFFELVRGHVLPNLYFDLEETTARRDAAKGLVKDYFEVSKNERIIGEHDKVTAEQERVLKALEQSRVEQEASRSPLVMFSLYASEALRLLLFSILFGGYIFVFHREIYADFGMLGAVFAVVLMYLVFMAVTVRFSLNPYLVPTAFASVMLAALFDIRLGFIVSVFCSMLVPLITSLPIGVSFASLLAGAAGVVGIDKMRSRSHVYSVFLHIAIAYVMAVFALGLGRSDSVGVVAMDALWGVANGMFSSAAVIFLLPIFEHVFNRTSRFTLLELTDLNKPILKRLNMEAHGTYHHSMLIGNLVDAVAEDIGADGLKARVMAYYHDIGKMFKPEYFAENQSGDFNKHEKITPQMSALILVSHVKDGVELAREEKLPEVIIDGIREHHGTSVMAFFYQKALETDSHSSVNRDDFRYPGPKPASKETGLLMCADSVEAAVRSLKDPTPANVRNMVTKLIDQRAHEGELDRSGLTLNDLALIKEKFISILTGIYHKRIAYPGQEEDSEPKGEAKEQGESVAKSV